MKKTNSEVQKGIKLTIKEVHLPIVISNSQPNDHRRNSCRFAFKDARDQDSFLKIKRGKLKNQFNNDQLYINALEIHNKLSVLSKAYETSIISNRWEEHESSINKLRFN